MLTSCGWFTKNEKSVNPESLKLINVLDKSMFDKGHIAGSIHIPFDGLKKKASEYKKSGEWNENTPIVVYCSNYACMASVESAKMLNKLGFKNVCAYEGGTAEWYDLSQKDDSFKIEGTNPGFYEALKDEPFDDDSDVCAITAEKLKKQLAETEKIK
jgi:rhodanese-related sulfurtransferase